MGTCMTLKQRHSHMHVDRSGPVSCTHAALIHAHISTEEHWLTHRRSSWRHTGGQIIAGDSQRVWLITSWANSGEIACSRCHLHPPTHTPLSCWLVTGLIIIINIRFAFSLYVSWLDPKKKKKVAGWQKTPVRHGDVWILRETDDTGVICGDCLYKMMLDVC